MLTLALETSTPHGSLSLFDDDHFLGEHAFEAERGHNSKIYAPLRTLLEAIGDRKLDRLVVGTGPGSYTGVRIAIAIAEALALSHHAERLGVCSFIGAGVGDAHSRYWIVGDARRQSWYRGLIVDGRLSGKILTEDRRQWEAAIQEALKSGEVVSTFDQRIPYPGVIQDRPTATRLIERTKPWTATEGPLEPCYLAAPYITTPKRKPVTL